MQTSHDAASLEQLRHAFLEAFRSNDHKALGACYTDEAVLMPPGRAIVSGRDAIVAFFQSAERIQDLIFEATNVKMLGDTALREAGNLLVTLRGRGRETRNVAAKYIALWVQAEGTWKLDSIIWNGAAGRRRGRVGGRGAGGRARPGGGGRGVGQGPGPGRGAGQGPGPGRGAGQGQGPARGAGQGPGARGKGPGQGGGRGRQGGRGN